MNNDTPPRRSGPHAPLPSAIAAAPTPPADPIAAALGAPDDPRARAAKRAAELRDHGALDEGTDKFFIDPRIIPDGWSYEYKRMSVYGKEDPSYQVALAQGGWEAVPLSRHPELMPINHAGLTIEHDGQILMERPLEITKEAKTREYRKAREQVAGKEAQLAGAPVGHFGRDNKGTPLAKVTKSYESIPIPE